MDVRESQPKNALGQSEVTELGRVMDLRESQLENAPTSIVVSVSGKIAAEDFACGHLMRVVAFLSYSTPSTDEYAVLPVCTLIFSNLLQPPNAR